MNKKLKTQKQALKEPLGTYYHPTKNTYRTGICEIGKVLRKGYTKKVKNKNIYVDPVCIKNKGKPGILINKKNKSKVKENKKMEKYIKEIKKTSYKSVIMKLYGELKKKDITEAKKKTIENDIEMLKKWRINNPNNKKTPNKELNKKKLFNNNDKIYNDKIFKSSLKEFEKNLKTDFLPTHKNNKPKNNKIKELSTKEILNLIKDN